MEKAKILYKEVRFILLDGSTEVYILAEASGDVPEGTHGVHFKSFPTSVFNSIVKILQHINEVDDNPLLWPLKPWREE